MKVAGMKEGNMNQLVREKSQGKKKRTIDRVEEAYENLMIH